MRSKKHASFTLFKHKINGGAVWYARFWDCESRRYAVSRSTGVLVSGAREHREEARAAARALQPEVRFKPAPAEVSFLGHLRAFWNPTNGIYLKDCRAMRKHEPSTNYVSMSYFDIDRHLSPFSRFKNLLLKDLTPGLIFDWIAWATDRGLSARRINTVLQCARVAVRHAVKRGDLARDPFAGVGKVPETSHEKGVLSIAEVQALCAANTPDPRMKLAVLLGCLCGMRRGEVRGLQWGDVDPEAGLIHIAHNYIDGEGTKVPKCGSARTVPLPESVRIALAALPFTGEGCRVLGNLATNEPISETAMRHGFVKIMAAVGIDEAAMKARNLTFHGLRHTFVTLARLGGVSDFEIQALAGHKSGSMMERYSHASQVIDFTDARKKMARSIKVSGE